MTPSTTPHQSHSPSMPYLPVPQSVSDIDMNFIMNIHQALNQSLEALIVASRGIGGSQMNLLTRYQYLLYMHKIMQGIFNLLSFMLLRVLQLMDVSIVYLQVLFYRILRIHPFLAQVLPILVLSLLSLHTATIVYSSILYIQEVISMATEVDPEIIIA